MNTATQYPGRRRRGVTFVELMVYMVIFTLVAGFVLQLVWGGRKADEGRKRLGIFQNLRISSLKVNRSLSQATRILFPPADGKPYHQVVYLSERGELMVLFLNDKDNLYLMNYDAVKKNQEQPALLARRTMEFNASRPPGTQDYLQYLARLKDERGVEFALTDGILVRNIMR